MSLMGSNAVVEQLSGSYPEEAVLDRLGWLYEEQIQRACEEIFALLPEYRQRVDKVTYALEKERFLMLLDHAHEDGLSVQELEAVFKRLIEHRQVFTAEVQTTHVGSEHGEHWVYQCNFPELFERLENLTFGGETEVDLDGVVYSVALGADSQGKFYLLRAQS